MSGINRSTGQPLSGWDHVQQSIEVIFTTRFGERIMREWFGSSVPNLLGELANPRTFIRFYSAVARSMSIKELSGMAREPRFKITKFVVVEVTRTGTAAIEIHGIYMPRALQGDNTPEGPRVITITPDGLRGLSN